MIFFQNFIAIKNFYEFDGFKTYLGITNILSEKNNE